MPHRISKRARLMARTARRLIADGIGIIALKPRSKQPDARFCPNGSHNATLDLAEVRRWLACDAEINLAGVLRKTDYLVVDVDGPDGAKAARALGPLPPTLTTKTPNGTHRYYRHGGDVKGSRIKLSDDLDIIASGYVLLPLSNHPDGGTYISDDWSCPIAKLPTTTLKAIRRNENSQVQKQGCEPQEVTIGQGRRDNALTSIAGALRRQGYGADLISTALRAIDRKHCDPPLGTGAIRRIARSVERYDPADAELFGDMSAVDPRNVDFSWFPYLVRGAVNLLEGDPGTGKTYLLCTIAACFSAGIPLPGQKKARGVGVLFMSAEDDPDTTLVRRLSRMGADLTRITYTKRYAQLDERTFGLIEKHVQEKGIELVILDPLFAYMERGIDMNKANETRPFMARLAELAKRLNITIIGLRHITKSNPGKAIYRGLGSIDITAASRSALMLGIHPEDEDMRVLLHIKHNLSERGASLAYELVGGNYEGGKVPRLKWLGEVNVRPEDLEPRPGQAGRPDDARQAAKSFLQNYLRDRARPVKDVLAAGERRSFSERTLRRAAKDLGLEKEGKFWKIAKTSL